jgi:hypothetical protein
MQVGLLKTLTTLDQACDISIESLPNYLKKKALLANATEC